ncbi:MAG: hypothetical protein J6O61_18825 [Butyrivibrio sp.]|uniref:C1 family peptidase n=1 Tax=Butyrivibrio sp. TaxID=28121 RepID=UPI001B16C2C8|nr:C1 family peptidase [Butyrivibrio sp.]MBO6242857.1 hypothetical protein [Butyrivibrio sp.]
MKKKVIVITVITVVIVVIAWAVIGTVKPSNPSRRDGGGSIYDEDLSAVDGSLLASNEVRKKSTSAPGLQESVVGGGDNNPTSVHVDKVRQIMIPEAVTIADGDEGAFYSNEEYQNVIPTDISTFSMEEIPQKYDSRDVYGKCFVTETEDQGYSSLCWTYAALGAIESDILKHSENIGYEDIDLSEKHLSYYNLHKSDTQRAGDISGDYRELVNSDNEEGAWIFDYDTGYVAVGGVTNYCISLLTAWKGPVSEKDVNSFKSMYGKEFLFKDNNETPSDAFDSEYHVQDVGQILASGQNRDYVKRMIAEHGAVSVGVNADSIYWKNHDKNLYSYFDGSVVPTANHEVLIVGWDDGYSSSNFGKTPPGDGAWICKNSWGKGSGENGYFYLSYYDETACSGNVAAYSVALPGTERWYDNNYQAAGFITNLVDAIEDEKNYIYALTSAGNPYGMMYEAKGDEELKAIGLMALETYQQYEVEVFVNPKSDEKGIDLSLLQEPDYSQKMSSISGGYHTFEFDDPVELNENDKFFILIKPYTKGRLVFEKADDYVSESNYDEWNDLLGAVHNHYEASGKSYYISDDGMYMEIETDKDFFVKAYTNNR